MGNNLKLLLWVLTFSDHRTDEIIFMLICWILLLIWKLTCLEFYLLLKDTRQNIDSSISCSMHWKYSLKMHSLNDAWAKKKLEQYLSSHQINFWVNAKVFSIWWKHSYNCSLNKNTVSFYNKSPFQSIVFFPDFTWCSQTSICNFDWMSKSSFHNFRFPLI